MAGKGGRQLKSLKADGMRRRRGQHRERHVGVLTPSHLLSQVLLKPVHSLRQGPSVSPSPSKLASPLFQKSELSSIPHSLSDTAASLFSFNTKLLERVIYHQFHFLTLLLSLQASAPNLAFETVLTKIVNDLTLQNPKCNF